MLNRLRGLFGTKDEPEAKGPHAGDFAFVLLRDARLPTVDAIAGAYSAYASGSDRIVGSSSKDASSSLTIELAPGATVIIASMPAPIPGGEAERNGKGGLPALLGEAPDLAHTAHAIVVWKDASSSTRLESIMRFTSVLAALVDATNAVGVYWGNAGVAHAAEFFVGCAKKPDVAARIALWTGIRVAHEGNHAVSMMSTGMQSVLGLRDLLVLAPRAKSGEAIEVLFDLLAYVASRGAVIPDGETCGRDADERRVVRHVPSPLDRKRKVWRVDLR